jgi:phosphate transport system permease protein
LSSFPSRFPEKAGIKSALFGTLWLITMTTLIAVPLGIGASIYLEEFAPKNRLSKFIELNIANLAGVPSIVYGILGLTIFVRWMHLGRCLLSGALIMALLILPIIIISSQEAIRAVPNSLRQAAYALGASRWQTVRHHVLPVSTPWILTGVILSISRAMGETAPLIMIGALTYIAFVPNGPMDSFTALPIQIFDWASRPQASFHQLAAAGIMVLLIVLLSLNALAIFLRQHYQKRLKW